MSKRQLNTSQYPPQTGLGQRHKKGLSQSKDGATKRWHNQKQAGRLDHLDGQQRNYDVRPQITVQGQASQHTADAAFYLSALQGCLA